jgi:hypothetical protein
LRIDEVRGPQLPAVVAPLDYHGAAGAHLPQIVTPGIHHHPPGAILQDEAIAIDFGDAALDRGDPAFLRYLGNGRGHGGRHLDGRTSIGNRPGPGRTAQRQQHGDAGGEFDPDRDTPSRVLPIDHLSTPWVVDDPFVEGRARRSLKPAFHIRYN